MRFAIVLALAAPAFAQVRSTGTLSSTGSGCHLHNGEWECPSTAVATITSTSAPAATSSGCIWHETHWHCDEPGHEDGPSADSHNDVDHDHDHADHADHAASDSDHDHTSANHDHDHTSAESASSDQCVIHVGHTHGNCSAADLACGAVLLEDYNLPLHIGAIFVILVTSALGVMIPLVAGRQSRHLDASTFGRGVGFWGNVFFLARHFGTGIILSTAFVHLLYHGFVMFANDCVGELLYEATAPALALAAAMATFLLDFVGSRAVHQSSDAAQTPPHLPHSPQSDQAKTGADVPVIATEVCSHTEAALRSEQGWQVVLLEAGIIFHSIMIGVTLGAGSGAGWTTLLIVLVFHQFFEGAALGARIALLYWISRLRAFIMGATFMLVTPIGVAIGIGVRRSFAQNGAAALLSVGVLNSVSAGILLYTAFKLLAADFVNGPLRTAKISRVAAAFSAVFSGLVAMSVLAKWA